jgi:hypothetical protein
MARRLVTATAHLTCWGRGRLNVFRTPDERIERACRTTIAPAIISKLVELRRQYYIRQQERRREAQSVSRPAAPETASPGGGIAPAPVVDSSERYLAAMLDDLQLRDTERGRLAQLLTHQSRCHSLWITIGTRERKWSQFIVLDSASHQKVVAARMVW